MYVTFLFFSADVKAFVMATQTNYKQATIENLTQCVSLRMHDSLLLRINE